MAVQTESIPLPNVSCMQPRTLGIRELNTSTPSTAIPMTVSDEIVSTSDVMETV